MAFASGCRSFVRLIRTDDLVIALPTSAGKTRIAELCILRALADGKRTVYVTPASRTLGPGGKSACPVPSYRWALRSHLFMGPAALTTVDAKTLQTASIVVATPEKLDFALRQDAEMYLMTWALIVFDEGPYDRHWEAAKLDTRYLIQRLLRRGDAYRPPDCLSLGNVQSGRSRRSRISANWLPKRRCRESRFNVQWRPTQPAPSRRLDWSARCGTRVVLAFLDGEKPFVPRFVESLAARKPRRNDVPPKMTWSSAFARQTRSLGTATRYLVYSPVRKMLSGTARPRIPAYARSGLSDVT